MLVDIANAVGNYLYDVFIGTADWGIFVGYVAQAMFFRNALCSTVDCVRARRQERHPDRVLGLLHRRRSDVARLRALPERPCLHPGADLRCVCLLAQSAIRHT
jgi:hypothetical protein